MQVEWDFETGNGDCVLVRGHLEREKGGFRQDFVLAVFWSEVFWGFLLKDVNL